MIDNKINILSLYLNSLGIHIPMRTIQESLDTPIADSVRGISYALGILHIEHDVYQIPMDFFDKIDCDFISMLHGDKRYCVVHRAKSDQVCVKYSRTESKKYSLKEFLKLWTGITIVVSPNQERKTYRFTKVQDALFAMKSNILLILLAFFMVMLAAVENMELQKYPHLLLMGIGVTISYSLLKEEYGDTHMRFCKIGKLVDCRTVLHAVSSFRGIKLSDLAFVYFFYMLLMAGFCNSFYIQTPLFLALIFILFSLWKQIKIKKVCLYCMGINVLLWVDVVWVALSFKQKFDVQNWDKVILALLIVYVGWNLFKSNMMKARKIARLKAKGSILYDEDLFNYFLNNSPKVEDINGEFVSTLGKKDALLKIVAITHPDCPNCQGVGHEMALLSDKAMIKWISIDHIDDHIRKFLRKYSITKTPTIIVNNHLLPTCYEFRDLKYII